MMRDRRVTFRKISEKVDISIFSAHSILTEDLVIITMLQLIPSTWFSFCLAKNEIRRAPYSPDMAPCNFLLFPKLKRPLKGKRFQTRANIMTSTDNPTRALNSSSLKCFLPSTDAIDRRGKIHACVWRFKVASCKHASLKSTRFSQKGRT
jgi:hypothetical protein